jgi:hypothetical protein
MILGNKEKGNEKGENDLQITAKANVSVESF